MWREEGQRGSHVLLAIAGTIAAARRFPVSSEQTLPSPLFFPSAFPFISLFLRQGLLTKAG